MKANLMFRDKDFDLKAKPCFGHAALAADFEFGRILAVMAGDDDAIIHAACSAALFRPLESIDAIRYRQENLRDALSNPGAVRRLYEIATETLRRKRDAWFWASTSRHLSTIFSSAVDVLKIYTKMLAELRLAADSSMQSFYSEGFVNLLTVIQRELGDDYLAEVRAHLDDLKDGNGMLISAEFGNYLQGVGYVLRRKDRKGFWRRWSFAPAFAIAPRDDAGARDLGHRRELAINEAANALAQAAEHLEGFFTMLQSELAFYVGCLNLADRMRELNMPICIPKLLPWERYDSSPRYGRFWRELYDVSLALTKNAAVVGNSLNADNKRLYIVTGANQGGKSTFLRSMGQAQLMAQCGMFVGAEIYAAPVRRGIFSHFKREEDAAMKSGKLDEELSRMNEIAGHLQSGSLVLFNESFAATNEREGSEICRQITRALTQNGVEVFSVTHLYTYAASFLEENGTQHLRAQRLENNERTFKILPGEPLQTAFGEDLYKKIFEKRIMRDGQTGQGS